MDIDGVVLRGKSVIPGSDEAIRMMREAGVPFSFMTNGGGVTEPMKAKQLEHYLGIDDLGEERVLLSHTPMRRLAERYRNRRVVVVGSADTVAVAKHYGYDFDGGWAVTPAQIAAGTPGIYPPAYGRDVGLPPVDINADGQPRIEAVLIFYDPTDWVLELQVLTDILAGGHPAGAGLFDGDSPCRQAVDVFASNPDFLWQDTYPVPRYGQGAFLDCLRTLWRRSSSGAELHINEFGKPHASQFAVAQQMLEEQMPAGRALQRIYMMGDNPAADIRGANTAHGDAWRSVLVCTGVYRGGEASNDVGDPAWRVEPDLHTAVKRLLRASEDEHASW